MWKTEIIQIELLDELNIYHKLFFIKFSDISLDLKYGRELMYTVQYNV